MSLISGRSSSYLTTAQAIVPHWQNANSLNPTHPIVLKGGYTFVNFLQDRDILSDKLDSVRASVLVRNTAATLRDSAKQSIRTYLTRYRATIISHLMDTPYARNLPQLPHPGSDETAYKEPFLRLSERWKIVNNLGATFPGFTAPLVLGNGTTLALFLDALAELEELYREINIADVELDTHRQERDILLDPFKKRMQQYKAEMLSRYGNDHPLVKSLPNLTSNSSTTPDPVALNGIWDIHNQKATLTWTPSPLAGVRYEIRTTGSASYQASQEQTLAVVESGTTRFETDAGLGVPGASAHFKVYVLTPSGQERGSRALKVVHPA